MKLTTLSIILDTKSQSVLMIEKKTGQGKGFWNFPGGKIEKSENPKEALKRESIEETGVEPIQPTFSGLLRFKFSHQTDHSWDNLCGIYVSREYRGKRITETPECTSHWIPTDQIPYEKMWPGDKIWVPEVLQGKRIQKEMLFDQKNQLIKMSDEDFEYDTTYWR